MVARGCEPAEAEEALETGYERGYSKRATDAGLQTGANGVCGRARGGFDAEPASEREAQLL